MEIFVRGAATSVIALYVIGLLAVNGYLFSLGVSDFALVRARFVYTGSLIAGFALFSFVVPFLSCRSLIHYWTAHRSEWSRRNVYVVIINILRFLLPTLIFWMIFSILQGVVVPIDNYPYLSTRDTSEWLEKPLRQGLVLAIAGLLVGLGVLRLWAAWRTGIRRGDLLVRAGSFLMLASGSIILFGSYLLVFMTTVYVQMPEQFGGGEPRSVRILLHKDAIDGVRELGVPIPKGARASQLLDLMYVGSETYVVELKNGKILQIKKDLVSAVITRNP